MSFIREIHQQKAGVRFVLFMLSSFIVIVSIGFFWFTSFKKDISVVFQKNEEGSMAVETAQKGPIDLFISGLSSMTARIGDLLGFDVNKGLVQDKPSQSSGVYMLPLSD